MISDSHMFLSADIIIYLKITKKGDSKNSEMDTPEERLRRRREPLSSCTRSVTSHPVPPSCSQSSLLKHEEQYLSLDKKRKKFHIQASDPSFKCPFLLSVLWPMTDSESLMESTWNHFPQNLEKNISNALQVPGSSHILLVGKNIGTSVLKSSLAIY